jgi:hypothetical protein
VILLRMSDHPGWGPWALYTVATVVAAFENPRPVSIAIVIAISLLLLGIMVFSCFRGSVPQKEALQELMTSLGNPEWVQAVELNRWAIILYCHPGHEHHVPKTQDDYAVVIAQIV